MSRGGGGLRGQLEDFILHLFVLRLYPLFFLFDGVPVATPVPAGSPKFLFLGLMGRGQGFTAPFQFVQTAFGFIPLFIRLPQLRFGFLIARPRLALLEGGQGVLFAPDDRVGVFDGLFDGRNPDGRFDGAFYLVERGVVGQLGDFFVVEKKKRAMPKGRISSI